MIRQAMVGVVASALSGSLAWAVATNNVTDQIKEKNVRIEERQLRQDESIALVNRQVDRLSGNLEKLIEQNTKLIALWEIRNQTKP